MCTEVAPFFWYTTTKIELKIYFSTTIKTVRGAKVQSKFQPGPAEKKFIEVGNMVQGFCS